MEFVYNYTMYKLPRHLKVHSDNVRDRIDRNRTADAPNRAPYTAIELRDINAHTFDDNVINSNKVSERNCSRIHPKIVVNYICVLCACFADRLRAVSLHSVCSMCADVSFNATRCTFAGRSPIARRLCAH